jgi:hypothetical protein
MSTSRTASGTSRLLVGVVAILAAVTVMGAAPAAAAPPGNDARTAPQAIGSLPATVRGTTAEATVELDEPASGCGRAIKNSVWYAFTAPSQRSVLLALNAAGDMDAAVDVFLRQRSQLSPVSCQLTNSRGEATIDLDVAEGASYLVRVAALSNSVADAFSLLVVEPEPSERLPGRKLPAAGVASAVDRFGNPDDAWATRLTRGQTYRLNFVTKGDGCATVAVLRPGSRSFGAASLVERRCDSHVVFAAPESGTYSIHVRAPRASRQQLPYRLRLGVALQDDTAPGLRLLNDRAVRGSLTGSELDALDLYRFSVAQRSDLTLRLRSRGAFELSLLSAGGRRLGSGTAVDRRMQRGHYFVAVRALDGANGSYTLRRIARAITSARTLVDGQRKATVAEGRSVVLSVAVRPAVGGQATMLVERFDPVDGWLFHARHHAPVVGGRAAVSFRPPTVGRWRVTGSYEGTRTSSRSDGGTATLLVTEPITG